MNIREQLRHHLMIGGVCTDYVCVDEMSWYGYGPMDSPPTFDSADGGSISLVAHPTTVYRAIE